MQLNPLNPQDFETYSREQLIALLGQADRLMQGFVAEIMYQGQYIDALNESLGAYLLMADYASFIHDVDIDEMHTSATAWHNNGRPVDMAGYIYPAESWEIVIPDEVAGMFADDLPPF